MAPPTTVIAAPAPSNSFWAPVFFVLFIAALYALLDEKRGRWKSQYLESKWHRRYQGFNKYRDEYWG